MIFTSALANAAAVPALSPTDPFEDVVVVLAGAVRARGLAGEVLAQHRRVGLHGLERIDDDGQLLVLHLDGLHAVGRRVAVLGDDEGDLLVLEQHLAVGQHHLHVAAPASASRRG